MLSYFSIEDKKSRIIGRHSVWRNTIEGGETIGRREINMKEKQKRALGPARHRPAVNPC